MKILAIDTATEACSVALWLDGELRERFAVAGREHSGLLPAMVHGLAADCGLRLGQLDGIVCGRGPGSFAGVRIGIAFAKGLALGLDRPAAGVSSLAMLAQGAILRSGARQVLAAIDARMGEIYWGVYVAAAGVALALIDEAVIPPSRATAPEPGEYAAAGSGWRAYERELRRVLSTANIADIEPDALPRAADALPIALPLFAAGNAPDGAALRPVYLRNRVALTSAEQALARAGRQQAEK
jgi:tRNA threonylcarbamoyladenosine biosynthesis protein TsaB